MKVLCLHGYAQSGPVFARKCAHLTEAFSQLGLETIFANGALPLAEIESNSEDYDTGKLKNQRDMRTWWPISNSDPKKYRMEESLESLKEVAKTHGPFVGVLGFSQGGGLAGVLAGNIGDIFPGHPPLKFAVLFSGFRLSLPVYQYFYDHIIDIPTCHIIGQYDTIVDEERSTSLWDACEPTNRIRIIHPGSHFVPTSPQITEEVVSFVKHSLA